jgi:predicted MFS family arabinose efflux permease
VEENSPNPYQASLARDSGASPPPLAALSRETLGLMALFGAMYFVQGIAEPTEGLIAQPVRSLLRSWDYSADAIGRFIFFLSLPWVIKPLYGLLTDFVPLAGTRRRSYLILSSGATVLGLAIVYFFPPDRGEYLLLLLLLLVPTVGVAFSDVVVDALMVEKGQPRNLTGRLQSVQWTAMNVATVGAALVGGYLSKHGLQTTAFLICAVATLVTLVLAWTCVREEPFVRSGGRFREATNQLVQAFKNPAILAAATFLFLWSFNPFISSSVLYTHMTGELQLGEQFYGVSVSVVAVGWIAGSLAYGIYCRRTPVRWLIHGSILAGILATVTYWGLSGARSALAISFVVGFVYMSGSLAQLDLAARACPVAAAGSVFALLMSASNLAMASSELVGGKLYVMLGQRWGNDAAFDVLVGIGAATTCGCWLVAPFLGREVNK